ncbi:MAG: GNAT family N-acetyltransferase [Ktedonobacterales bacterium]
MPIELWQAASVDQERFRRLYELYSYDFSDIYQLDVDDTGSYGSDDLTGCWVESWRMPFLFRVDGKPGGFAIVDRRSHMTSDPDVWDMAEFFVLRKYRRRRIGRHVQITLHGAADGVCNRGVEAAPRQAERRAFSSRLSMAGRI